ncbi:MAG: transglutaminase family protein [Phycisphaeraceae bacterium]|nr:transglutaminase family protein [Phycisphaeraceae bacterium]
MILHITHVLTYRYSRPVFLEPTTLRLRPRSDAAQTVLRFSQTLSPTPAGVSDSIDLDGNAARRIWFACQTDAISIRTQSSVHTLRDNPFDFLLSDEEQTLPVHIPAALIPYATRSEPASCVDDLVADCLRQADNRTLPFLTTLTQRLCQGVRNVLRDVGPPLSARQTLLQGEGACRDQAVLMIDAVRAAGLPARFVSGYVHSQGPMNHELHAWCEAYLPGAGWRGFDPTNGLAVVDRHVALAAGVNPEDAACLSGTFRGTDATTSMSYEVNVAAQ